MPRGVSHFKVACARVITCDLNSRYDEVEVQVCTKYSAYFEMSKGNNEMFRVQILGSHLRSREVYRVCMDIIHSLHERYIFIRTYVCMGKARRHEGVLPYPTGRAEDTYPRGCTSCTCVRCTCMELRCFVGHEKCLSVPLWFSATKAIAHWS